jgi:Ca2+-binding RTX toxin-like protein
MAYTITYSLDGAFANGFGGTGSGGAVAASGTGLFGIADSADGVSTIGYFNQLQGGASAGYSQQGTDADIAYIGNGQYAIVSDLGSSIGCTIVDQNLDIVSSSTMGDGNVGNAAVAALAGGGFVTAYEHVYSASDTDIKVRVVKDGQSVDFAVNTSGALDADPSVAALTGGGFAIAWQRTVGTETELWYAVYNDDGSIRKMPTLRDTTGTINGDPQVIALKDGGFAILYEDNGWTKGGHTEITFSRLDANGTWTGHTNLTTTSAGDHLLSATVLDDGLVAVASGDGNESGLITLYDPITMEVVHEEASATAGFRDDGLDLAAIPGGGFVMLSGGGGQHQSFSYTPKRHIEGDHENDVYTGDSLADWADGNGGNDTLSGEGGADRLDGGVGQDMIDGGAGNDLLVATGDEIVTGEVLNGGTGVDTLLCDDSYLHRADILSIERLKLAISSNSQTNVLIDSDQIGGGQLSTQLQISGNLIQEDSIQISMGTDQWLSLAGVTFVDMGEAGGRDAMVINGDDDAEVVTGSSITDEIAGNGGADVLKGGGGADRLWSGAGLDKSYGGEGDDSFAFMSGELEAGEIIDGGAGADEMHVAGTLDFRSAQIASIEMLSFATSLMDPFVAKFDAAQLGDGLAQNFAIKGGSGVSEVQFTMGDETSLDLSQVTLEEFGPEDQISVLGDATAETIIGSAVRDDIRGGDGIDRLDGGGGTDSLRGGLGNDIYTVDTAGEAIEAAGQGTDLVKSSVSYTLGANLEKLTLTGDGNSNGSGNDLANTILGNAANNVLNGKGGKDVLTGGAGADAFLFNSALDPLGNVDKILDFEVGVDKIRLDDAIFTGLTNAGKAGAFHVGTAAADANDRIIYNPETGALLFDADGAGGEAAIRFATLEAGLDLKATDFLVI